MPFFQDDHITLHHGDALETARTLETESVQCIVTSPPYFGLRDYGTPGQYGLEATPAAYVENLRALFAELRRALTDDGTLWLNIGDSYNAYNGNRGKSKTGFSRNDPLPELPKGAGLTVKGLPAKNLLGIPWRAAFALQDDGWILRNSIIWAKTNGMPESVKDRLSSSHENLFMFSKSQRYHFDLDAIRATGERNPGDVWNISTQPFTGAHFAVFPPELARRCVVAGSRPGDAVLDPFSGSGTTGMVAQANGRRYVGIDISAEYLNLSLRTRLANGVLNLG